MKNYVIQFEPAYKDQIVNLVENFSNDVQLDRVEEDRVGITIELEDKESDRLYRLLIDEVFDRFPLHS